MKIGKIGGGGYSNLNKCRQFYKEYSQQYISHQSSFGTPPRLFIIIFRKLAEMAESLQLMKVLRQENGRDFFVS
jgi:hypothetical protein